MKARHVGPRRGLATRPGRRPLPPSARGTLAALLLAWAAASPAEPPPTPSAPQAMELPSAWEAEAELLVARQRGRARSHGLGADEGFELGGYRVSAVRRSPISQGGWSLGSWGKTSAAWALTFQLQGAAAWEGRCERRSRALSLGQVLGQPGPVNTLRCECHSGERQAQFEISDEWLPAAGSLRLDTQSLQLSTAPGMEARLDSPAPAFVVRDEEEQRVAAIETLHPGRSWQHPRLPAAAREPMACLTAGLLLGHAP